MERIVVLTNKNEFPRVEKTLCEVINSETFSKIKVDTIENEEIIFNFPSSRIEYFQHLISSMLVKYLLENIEKELIREIVEYELHDAPEDELEEFTQKVWVKMYHKEGRTLEDRTKELYDIVYGIVTSGEIFDLDGFLQFRFKSRFFEIQEYVYDVIDDILEEDEVEDYIKVMRQFVYVQLPKIDHAHVICITDEDFEITTSDHEKIDLEQLEKSLNEMNIENGYKVTKLDLIVSVLLSSLPKDIFIHHNKNSSSKIVGALKLMYEGRHYECGGCEFCEAVRDGGLDDYSIEDKDENLDWDNIENKIRIELENKDEE